MTLISFMMMRRLTASLTNEETEVGILTAEERTFFTSFDSYTTEYEQRTYNNMPHNIYPDTMIQPTRDPRSRTTDQKARVA